MGADIESNNEIVENLLKMQRKKLRKIKILLK